VYIALRRHGVAVLLAAIVVCLGIAAGCRRVPVLDTAPRPTHPDSTIRGIIRGPEGTSAIAGRMVEAIEVESGERQRETTSSTGGFTFRLKPGKYRVELPVREGERIVEQPGVIDLNKSDVDAHADIVLGVARTSHRRAPGSSTDSGLGPPIA
jgi:hypothetical protein